jgi:hypothetical protein
MELLVQFFFELLLQLIGGIFVGGFLHFSSSARWIQRSVNALYTAILFFVLGTLMGLFSILFFPTAFVRSSSLHGISLLITPVLAGAIMSLIGLVRERQGKPVVRLESFTYGFIFAFAIALIRFLFTK